MKVKNKNSKVWIAAHLYQCNDFSTFLLNGVKPFVEKIAASSKMIEQFFFIRYWEKGPHIRLRFKVEASEVRWLKSELESHFNRYFELYPSKRGSMNVQNMYPNDSVQFLPYEPEFSRYGGKEGILIAEELFEASSKIVLDLLSDDWNYDLATGVAIQLHLILAFGFKMNRKEAVDFFEFSHKTWFSFACPDLRGTSYDKVPQAAKKEVINTFRKSYADQGNQIASFIDQIWRKLETDVEPLEEPFAYWREKIFAIAEKIEKLDSKKTLSRKTNENSIHKKVKPLLDSYVHMTNNRLGILNRDESFISFLLVKSLATQVP